MRYELAGELLLLPAVYRVLMHFQNSFKVIKKQLLLCIFVAPGNTDQTVWVNLEGLMPTVDQLEIPKSRFKGTYFKLDPDPNLNIIKLDLKQ